MEEVCPDLPQIHAPPTTPHPTPMLELDLQLDTPIAPLDRPAVRHLIARVVPPAADPTQESLPLDLALVIDASGSMNGSPLDAAKQAARDIARELPPSSRLTVVSFADDVVVHADGVALEERSQQALASRIAEIQPRGCTNLHSGWQTACALLEAAPEVGRRRHVVVLSDGMANKGITDPGSLAHEARSWMGKGVTTSCVGVGDHYEQRQLSALADHGGGETHHAENAPEIVEILLGEVLSLASICAENVELVLDLPEGVSAEELSGDMPSTREGSRLTVMLGALREGRARTAVVRLEIDALARARHSQSGLELLGLVRCARGANPESREPQVARVRLAFSHEAAPAPDLARARAVLDAWQSRLVRRATDLNRDSDFAGLERLWAEELPEFNDYARHHAETHEFVETIAAVRRRTSRPMRERSRKLGQDMVKKAARATVPHYVADKGSVRSLFERE